MDNKTKTMIKGAVLMTVLVLFICLPQEMLTIISGIIEIVLILGLCIVLPFLLTFRNFRNLFRSEQKYADSSFWGTIIIGGILYIALSSVTLEQAGDWDKAVYPFQLHNSISSEYSFIPEILVLAGVSGLAVLHHVKSEKLPPLVSALSAASVIMLNIFQIAYAVQISGVIFKNFSFDFDADFCLMLYLYHLNILVLSVNTVRRYVISQAESSEADEEDQSFAHRFLNKASNYPVLVFFMLFFFIALMEIICILTGYGADAPVKMFTDTADWTFSQQIPPPPAEYQGHYLCTVAAGGHRKIVKPLRRGKRHGATIIVNRQLCIANAFEDYIYEKLPRFHRFVRGTYDRIGFPVSQLIDTPLKADIIYILMKPLEWIFLIFLYLFDINPEKRISRQYEYK